MAEKGNLTQSLFIAALIGFLAGMAIATIRERTHMRVETAHDLPAGASSFRGRITPGGSDSGEMVAVAADLVAGRAANSPSTVIVVSAVDDTLPDNTAVGVASNLAAAISDYGTDAIAVSAVEPDVDGVRGLARVLGAARHGDTPQRELDRALIGTDPAVLRERLALLAPVAVIATGPIGTAPAAAALAPTADTAVLLVAENVTMRESVLEADRLAQSRTLPVHGYLLCATAGDSVDAEVISTGGN